MINDVRALERPGALEAARATGLPVCLMHRQGEPDMMQLAPRYASVLDEVNAYLQSRVEACEEAGIARERLILDPGFGFGKTLEHNLQLFAHLRDLRPSGLPVLVGVSRKSMIGQALDRPVDQRLYGSLALAALATEAGAAILRVHDVAETADVVRMVEVVNRARRS
jgi:dihydropteroate synthase